MHVDIGSLIEKHNYARAHGARSQQNKAFVCLLYLALEGLDRLDIEIHADPDKSAREAAKSALVAIYDAKTKRRVRAPLFQQMEVDGVFRQFSRMTVAMIAIEATNTVPLELYSSGGEKRMLTALELSKLDADIVNAAGGRVPNLFDSGMSRVPHAA